MKISKTSLLVEFIKKTLLLVEFIEKINKLILRLKKGKIWKITTEKNKKQLLILHT